MKKTVIVASFLFSLNGSVSAAEVPDDTPLRRLGGYDLKPYLVPQQHFECSEMQGLENKFFKLTCSDDFSNGTYGGLSVGARIPVAGIYANMHGHDLDIAIGTENDGTLRFAGGDLRIDGKYASATVGELKALLKGWMKIESDDPYLNLREEEVRNTLLKQIVQKVQEKDFQSAMPLFRRLEDMLEKKGDAVPESLQFYYIQALQGIGKKDAVQARINQYLKKFGKSGKYYDKVMLIQSGL